MGGGGSCGWKVVVVVGGRRWLLWMGEDGSCGWEEVVVVGGRER